MRDRLFLGRDTPTVHLVDPTSTDLQPRGDCRFIFLGKSCHIDFLSALSHASTSYDPKWIFRNRSSRLSLCLPAHLPSVGDNILVLLYLIFRCHLPTYRQVSLTQWMLAELWSPQSNLSIYFILLSPHVFLNSIPCLTNMCQCYYLETYLGNTIKRTPEEVRISNPQRRKCPFLRYCIDHLGFNSSILYNKSCQWQQWSPRLYATSTGRLRVSPASAISVVTLPSRGRMIFWNVKI